MTNSSPRLGASGDPAISRRRFLIAGGITVAGLAVVAINPFDSGDSNYFAPTLSGAGPFPDPTKHTFDVVIKSGRVMDPETGFDEIADVGIDGATITGISAPSSGESSLRGRSIIDARGLVVAPGFIDILSYAPNPYGIWFKVADGVTTNLGLHGIQSRAEDFFSTYGSSAQRPPTHYGGAFSNPWTRSQLGLGIDDASSTKQIDALVATCDEDLRKGYVAVDFEPEYTPGVGYDEIKALAEVAKNHNVPATFHARYSDDMSPGTNAEALAEVLQIAQETKAQVHVEHIISTGGTFTMAQSLKTLNSARNDGISVTACMYPYNYWATYLASARFNDGWQERFHISYKDLAIVGTGERLNASTFAKYKKQNSLCAAFAIPESDVREALQTPWVMLGSDAILEPGNKNHPRSTGCFARGVGRYVREEKVLDLMPALAKATILPAQLTEKGAPIMRQKGRMQKGADADVTIFDPKTLLDLSTVENPGVESKGVKYVLISGQVVRNPNGNQTSVRPGLPVTRQKASV